MCASAQSTKAILSQRINYTLNEFHSLRSTQTDISCIVAKWDAYWKLKIQDLDLKNGKVLSNLLENGKVLSNLLITLLTPWILNLINWTSKHSWHLKLWVNYLSFLALLNLLLCVESLRVCVPNQVSFEMGCFLIYFYFGPKQKTNSAKFLVFSSYCFKQFGWVHRGRDFLYQLLWGQLCSVTHQGELQQWQTLVYSETQKVKVGEGWGVQEWGQGQICRVEIQV